MAISKEKFILSKEKKDFMISEIKSYFDKERDEEIGDLGALLLLDFISEKLGSEFYNQGVSDSYKFLTERCEDLLGIQK